jgi:vanillate O-demethylase monooxygenase subunit
MSDEAWIRNCWQVAAYAEEIGPQLFARTFMDEPVVLWRVADGSVVALADRCAHRFVPLSAGRLDETDTIQCGYHGMRFDRGGHCVGVPGQSGPLPRANVRAFPIVERHGFVWIWMGVPNLADPVDVPDVHWFNDPEWLCIGGYRYVAASYRLINDNLLDLSHESFVHGDTIGNTAVADAPFVTEIIDDRVVKLHREMLGCDPPPAYRQSTGFTTKIDRTRPFMRRRPSTSTIMVRSRAAPAWTRRRKAASCI